MGYAAGVRALRSPEGRASYYVFTESGNSIDEILVRSGVAQASRRPGAYRDQLLAAEAEAPTDKSMCYWSR